MKKNLLSILILALLIVNLVLTAIMMVSVIGTNNKTGALVTSVASAMNLELYQPGGGSAASVPLSQTATYALADRMMVQLPPNEDGSTAMIIFNVSLAMNTEHEDYASMGSSETLASFEIQIRDAIASVVNQYTEEECRANFETIIRADILKAVQNLFQSDFIYGVSVSDVMYQ